MNYPELNDFCDVLTLPDEMWRDIEGYEGVYQVSNLGRVKSLTRVQMSSNKVCTFPVTYKERVLRANPNTKGYPQVQLTYPTKRLARVHRLVAETFLREPSDELVNECISSGITYVPVNHKDENINNANVLNLEWCSIAFNNTYGKSRKANPKVSGSASVKSILKEDQVLDIIKLLEAGRTSQVDIADMFGVQQITISNIWTGRSWSHLTGKVHVPQKRLKHERKLAFINESEIH